VSSRTYMDDSGRAGGRRGRADPEIQQAVRFRSFTSCRAESGEGRPIRRKGLDGAPGYDGKPSGHGDLRPASVTMTVLAAPPKPMRWSHLILTGEACQDGSRHGNWGLRGAPSPGATSGAAESSGAGGVWPAGTAAFPSNGMPYAVASTLRR